MAVLLSNDQLGRERIAGRAFAGFNELCGGHRVVASTPSSPKHLDIFQGAPLRLLTPLSDQFPVRVCSCPLCIINRLCMSI